VTPFGPVVVPLTWPLPATIDVETPPDGDVPRYFEVTTLQLPFDAEPLVELALELVELPELLELLDVLQLVCAVATDAPRPSTATDTSSAFMAEPPCERWPKGWRHGAAASPAFERQFLSAAMAAAAHAAATTAATEGSPRAAAAKA